MKYKDYRKIVGNWEERRNLNYLSITEFDAV